MGKMKFNRELYSKVALLKAAYNYTDTTYVHLDADKEYYYVSLTPKSGEKTISESEFLNEMLAQSVRHEIYNQTKNIRKLMYARALATSVVDFPISPENRDSVQEHFSEDEILKDWFTDHEDTYPE